MLECSLRFPERATAPGLKEEWRTVTPSSRRFLHAMFANSSYHRIPNPISHVLIMTGLPNAELRQRADVVVNAWEVLEASIREAITSGLPLQPAVIDYAAQPSKPIDVVRFLPTDYPPLSPNSYPLLNSFLVGFGRARTASPELYHTLVNMSLSAANEYFTETGKPIITPFNPHHHGLVY